MQSNDMMRERLKKLEKMINVMLDTLEFYAQDKNWEDTNEIYTGEGMVNYSSISVDGGEAAQRALELYKTMMED